jgi:hypothetical protein
MFANDKPTRPPRQRSINAKCQLLWKIDLSVDGKGKKLQQEAVCITIYNRKHNIYYNEQRLEELQSTSASLQIPSVYCCADVNQKLWCIMPSSGERLFVSRRHMQNNVLLEKHV